MQGQDPTLDKITAESNKLQQKEEAKRTKQQTGKGAGKTGKPLLTVNRFLTKEEIEAQQRAAEQAKAVQQNSGNGEDVEMQSHEELTKQLQALQQPQPEQQLNPPEQQPVNTASSFQENQQPAQTQFGDQVSDNLQNLGQDFPQLQNSAQHPTANFLSPQQNVPSLTVEHLNGSTTFNQAPVDDPTFNEGQVDLSEDNNIDLEQMGQCMQTFSQDDAPATNLKSIFQVAVGPAPLFFEQLQSASGNTDGSTYCENTGIKGQQVTLTTIPKDFANGNQALKKKRDGKKNQGEMGTFQENIQKSLKKMRTTTSEMKPSEIYGVPSSVILTVDQVLPLVARADSLEQVFAQIENFPPFDITAPYLSLIIKPICDEYGQPVVLEVNTKQKLILQVNRKFLGAHEELIMDVKLVELFSYYLQASKLKSIQSGNAHWQQQTDFYSRQFQQSLRDFQEGGKVVKTTRLQNSQAIRHDAFQRFYLQMQDQKLEDLFKSALQATENNFSHARQNFEGLTSRQSLDMYYQEITKVLLLPDCRNNTLFRTLLKLKELQHYYESDFLNPSSQKRAQKVDGKCDGIWLVAWFKEIGNISLTTVPELNKQCVYECNRLMSATSFRFRMFLAMNCTQPVQDGDCEEVFLLNQMDLQSSSWPDLFMQPKKQRHCVDKLRSIPTTSELSLYNSDQSGLNYIVLYVSNFNGDKLNDKSWEPDGKYQKKLYDLGVWARKFCLVDAHVSIQKVINQSYAIRASSNGLGSVCMHLVEFNLPNSGVLNMEQQRVVSEQKFGHYTEESFYNDLQAIVQTSLASNLQNGKVLGMQNTQVRNWMKQRKQRTLQYYESLRAQLVMNQLDESSYFVLSHQTAKRPPSKQRNDPLAERVFEVPTEREMQLDFINQMIQKVQNSTPTTFDMTWCPEFNDVTDLEGMIIKCCMMLMQRKINFAFEDSFKNAFKSDNISITLELLRIKETIVERLNTIKQFVFNEPQRSVHTSLKNALRQQFPGCSNIEYSGTLLDFFKVDSHLTFMLSCMSNSWFVSGNAKRCTQCFVGKANSGKSTMTKLVEYLLDTATLSISQQSWTSTTPPKQHKSNSIVEPNACVINEFNQQFFIGPLMTDLKELTESKGIMIKKKYIQDYRSFKDCKICINSQLIAQWKNPADQQAFEARMYMMVAYRQTTGTEEFPLNEKTFVANIAQFNVILSFASQNSPMEQITTFDFNITLEMFLAKSAMWNPFGYVIVPRFFKIESCPVKFVKSMMACMQKLKNQNNFYDFKNQAERSKHQTITLQPWSLEELVSLDLTGMTIESFYKRVYAISDAELDQFGLLKDVTRSTKRVEKPKQKGQLDFTPLQVQQFIDSADTSQFNNLIVKNFKDQDRITVSKLDNLQRVRLLRSALTDVSPAKRQKLLNSLGSFEQLGKATILNIWGKRADKHVAPCFDAITAEKTSLIFGVTGVQASQARLVSVLLDLPMFVYDLLANMGLLLYAQSLSINFFKSRYLLCQSEIKRVADAFAQLSDKTANNSSRTVPKKESQEAIKELNWQSAECLDALARASDAYANPEVKDCLTFIRKLFWYLALIVDKKTLGDQRNPDQKPASSRLDTNQESSSKSTMLNVDAFKTRVEQNEFASRLFDQNKTTTFGQNLSKQESSQPDQSDEENSSSHSSSMYQTVMGQFNDGKEFPDELSLDKQTLKVTPAASFYQAYSNFNFFEFFQFQDIDYKTKEPINRAILGALPSLQQIQADLQKHLPMAQRLFQQALMCFPQFFAVTEITTDVIKELHKKLSIHYTTPLMLRPHYMFALHKFKLQPSFVLCNKKNKLNDTVTVDFSAAAVVEGKTSAHLDGLLKWDDAKIGLTPTQTQQFGTRKDFLSMNPSAVETCIATTFSTQEGQLRAVMQSALKECQKNDQREEDEKGEGDNDEAIIPTDRKEANLHQPAGKQTKNKPAISATVKAKEVEKPQK